MEENIKIEGNLIICSESGDKLAEEINNINEYKKRIEDVCKNALGGVAIYDLDSLKHLLIGFMNKDERLTEELDEVNNRYKDLQEEKDILEGLYIDAKDEIKKLKSQNDTHKELIARLTNELADRKEDSDNVIKFRERNIELEARLKDCEKRESSQSKTINQLVARKKYLDEGNKNLKSDLKCSIESSEFDRKIRNELETELDFYKTRLNREEDYSKKILDLIQKYAGDIYKVNDLISAENALRNHAEIRLLRENEIEVLKNIIRESALKFCDDIKKLTAEDLKS